MSGLLQCDLSQGYKSKRMHELWNVSVRPWKWQVCQPLEIRWGNNSNSGCTGGRNNPPMRMQWRWWPTVLHEGNWSCILNQRTDLDPESLIEWREVNEWIIYVTVHVVSEMWSKIISGNIATSTKLDWLTRHCPVVMTACVRASILILEFIFLEFSELGLGSSRNSTGIVQKTCLMKTNYHLHLMEPVSC